MARNRTADDPLLSYYARRAGEYEEIYALPERQADLAMLRTTVPHILAGLDVLEVACGTGYWTSVLAPACRSVVAADASVEVLARARAKRYAQRRVCFVVADAYDLGALSAAFNGGFAGFWWSHVPRQRLRAFLDGFHRRLRSGARLCFIDNRYVEGRSTPMAATDTLGNTYQRRTLKNGSEHLVLKNFPAAEELREVVGAAATEVEVTSLQYYWCLSYRLHGI